MEKLALQMCINSLRQPCGIPTILIRGREMMAQLVQYSGLVISIYTLNAREIIAFNKTFYHSVNLNKLTTFW